MNAAVYHGRGDIRVETVPDPVAGEGEAPMAATAPMTTSTAEPARIPARTAIGRPVDVRTGPLKAIALGSIGSTGTIGANGSVRSVGRLLSVISVSG